MTGLRSWIAAFALFALLVPIDGTAHAQAPYYEGKTVKVIVGLRAGGTADTFIRTFTDYWQKYVPGNPTMVVENMPGSGNLIATNHVYEAVEPDGLTLVYGPWVPTAQALDLPELRADYANFEFVGASSDIRVSYMRKDVPPGLTKPADIVKLETFNVGGNAPTDFVDLLSRMSLDLIGANYNYVTGYRGGSAIYAAILANEAQYANTSYGTLVTRSADFIAEGGDGMPVYYFCTRNTAGEFVRKELQGNIPCFVDLYEEIHGKPPSGPVWDALDWLVELAAKVTFLALAPPGTPQEAVVALREGFYKAAADEELQKLFVERTGEPVEFVPAEEGPAALEVLAATSDEIKKVLREYVESGQK
ncbi:MAG: hypothetical protein Q8P46_01225 [Hyphomicrobiales bacterium]|nr:hypothetical protein [Hyphomicrobiales bacterium]